MFSDSDHSPSPPRQSTQMQATGYRDDTISPASTNTASQEPPSSMEPPARTPQLRPAARQSPYPSPSTTTRRRGSATTRLPWPHPRVTILQDQILPTGETEYQIARGGVKEEGWAPAEDVPQAAVRYWDATHAPIANYTRAERVAAARLLAAVEGTEMEPTEAQDESARR
ncbi:hypothetical protein MBLNU230_g3240t1 [Neophaeotheca triangularis]